MNNINTNIAEIALTAYKNMQSGKGKNTNSLVKSALVSLGLELFRNSLVGKKEKNTHMKKLLLAGGLLFLSLNTIKK